MKNSLSILLITLFASLTLLTACGSGSDSNSDIKYVALGASDAVGFGALPLTNGYVYLIEDRLQDRGLSTDLTNLGIPGAQAGNIKDLALSETIRENPDLITLFTGANDLIDGDSAFSFEEDLVSIIKKLSEETNAFIVVATIPDLTKVDRFSDGSDADVTTLRIAQFNQAIVRTANIYNLPIADLSQINAGQYTADDGFHPNDGGHRIIADVFLSIIEPHFF